jgi:hypothetical protein
MHGILLQDGEHLKQRFRQTKFVLLGPGVLASLMLYIPWSVTIKYGVREDFATVLWIYSFLVLGYFSRAYALWFRIRYIITSARLIKISHEGLFKKIVIETPLDRILNVSYKTTGFFSSLLRYGNVEVQVVGRQDTHLYSKISSGRPTNDLSAAVIALKRKPFHKYSSKSATLKRTSE